MTKEEQVARIRGALERLLAQHEKAIKLNSQEAQMIAGRSLVFVAEVIEHEFLTLTDIVYKNEKEQSTCNVELDAHIAFLADTKHAKFDDVREEMRDLLRKAYTQGSNDAFKNLPEYVRDMAYKMRIQDDLADFKRDWNRILKGVNIQWILPVKAGMDFGAALQVLEFGHKVQRSGWNGSGLWLELQKTDANSKMTEPYIFLCYPEGAKTTTPGARVPWVPSQADMLAKDWQIVN